MSINTQRCVRSTFSFPALVKRMLLLLLLPVAIIGGWEAQPHSRPYMAFVKIGKRGHCGGFLIREYVVVTVAHCNCNLGTITVVLAAHNVSRQEPGRQEICVRHRIPHPEYNDETLENDIMLLQLESLAQVNDWVRPIKLPKAKQKVKPGTRCSVAGWGLTSSDTGKTSDVLMEVELPVKENKFCMNYFGRQYNYKSIGKSPSGDSGGPLVCNGVAQGIVSWDFKDQSAPEVYTRVSHFIPWIKKVMKKLPH
uniref:Peptidase S1 domain-containing protein n=1 Tax=Chrysemys picta bellii TaxID=8478 RepID=A0A8C3IRT9_CHRPI